MSNLYKLLRKSLPVTKYRHLIRMYSINSKEDSKESKEDEAHTETSPITPESDNLALSSNCSESRGHIPVMVEEVVKMLQPCGKKILLDMTLGAGGHTEALLSRGDDVTVFGLDRDPVTVKTAHRLKEKFGDRFIHLQGKFTDLPSLMRHHDVTSASLDGALFDLGASSMQFDSAVRGFSISKDGPLDMRMDWTRDDKQTTAADVVNTLYENDLYNIIKRYGEEKQARKIANAIVDARYTYGRIQTTRQLAQIISSVFEHSEARHDALYRYAHPATKTFQALRIFVNNEINELWNAIGLVHHYLKPGAVCVCIAFHSLEDRLVKQHFHAKFDAESVLPARSRGHAISIDAQELEDLKLTKWSPLSRKITIPEREEIERNPRARSAKLRAASKI